MIDIIFIFFFHPHHPFTFPILSTIVFIDFLLKYQKKKNQREMMALNKTKFEKNNNEKDFKVF
ncbi:hypothetical protein B6U98_01730 [Thermoplasmatales archaeon ex4572_165]|nr:MAG: hypothetical protein B6U98_01730 [Thermoplasmatales archaeon ex4572_165]